MLSFGTIEPHTLELLKALSCEPLLSDMRLVGGTSLALQYGHRKSVDLDFFGIIKSEITETREMLSSYGHVIPIKETKTIQIYQVNGIKIDFVDYSRHAWIDDAIKQEHLKLATPKDIAAMKINAIEGRGSRKDFIDIYFLLQHYSLSEILEFYKQKYPEHSFFRALMSLTYFEDAEQQMMPVMLSDISWEAVKQYISTEVKKIAQL